MYKYVHITHTYTHTHTNTYVTQYIKLPWDSFLTRCLEELQPAYQVTFPGQDPIVKREKNLPN